ncbi:MAG TPA: AzlD domain-containing protein [Anaerolineales bacterium]|nr:AzlD domain-containing protein [Anaerolineales bacterium]HMV98465.1 AzlD domain-containing protein [Anaerolineales bacterium]HMX19943.1 AzlD domain-containing protein [Anaerolineales bacterium]HMX72971.1 AzlD domain-containing protein [Anaerolineales bacterium]HMZ44822.1 AzlD domain-containing protein [Anaerolineales bacterium]
MSAASIWLLFLAIGLGTFTLRFLFIYLFGKIEMPDWLRRALRFVPAAALAALVFPALTHPTGHLDISLQNFRLLAGLGGAVVAWKTRNVLLTLIIGMILLWVLEAAFGV